MRAMLSEALTATSQSTLSAVAGALILGLLIAWLVLLLTTPRRWLAPVTLTSSPRWSAWLSPRFSVTGHTGNY